MSFALLFLLVLLAVASFAAAWALLGAVERRARRPGLPAAPAIKAPRHPLVLVHGILGFDEIGLFGVRQSYFRGIPRHLAELGVECHLPKLPPLSSVPERAERLAEFIRALPAGRVNVIAHSMGGLDARWAIARLALGDRIASVTTIGTPHRGTPVADLAKKRGSALLRGWASKVGLPSAAVDWLSTDQAKKFNEEITDDPRVFYASVICNGTRLGLQNPLLVPTHAWVRRRAGTNDGMVPCTSQRWGETLLEVPADHWGQVGWFSSVDTVALYEAIMRELAARGL